MASVEKQLKASYRSMYDAVQRLDALARQSFGLSSIFGQEAQKHRKRIRIHGERQLFLLSPRRERIEEIVWKRVFYDVIHASKQRKKEFVEGSRLSSHLKNHLGLAAGFYRHLINRLQKQFDLNLQQQLGAAASWIRLPEARGNATTDEDTRDWALSVCHRSLIYLGDLARYYLDFYGGSTQLATIYYKQAMCLDPANGLPHNQLALLSGSRNEKCDAAYHYLMCLASHQPFPGAEQNLKRIWDYCAQSVERLEQTYRGGAKEKEIRDVVFKKFLICFLDLQRLLHPPCQVAHQQHLTILNEKLLHDFIECLAFKLHSEDDDSPGKEGGGGVGRFFPGSLVLKIAGMAMLASYKLRLQGSVLTPSTIAFALSLFSQLLQHCVQSIDQWKRRTKDGRAQRSSTSNVVLPFEDRKKSDDPKASSSSRRRVAKRPRRRRRRLGNEEEDEDERDDKLGEQSQANNQVASSDSDLSEGPADFDSDCLSTDYSDVEIDETSEKKTSSVLTKEAEASIKRPLAIRFPGMPAMKEITTVDDPLSDSSSEDDDEEEQEEEELECAAFLRWLCEYELLPVVKIVCDWLRIHPAIATSCTQSSSAFWSRLADLLNVLPRDDSLVRAGLPSDERNEEAVCETWKQFCPLPEDFEFLGFPPLARSLDDMDLVKTREDVLTQGEQGLLRLKVILNFGYFVAKAKTVADFCLDERSGRFVGPSHMAQQEANALADKTKQIEESDKNRRAKLMKALAEQKLKSDVAELEQSLASAKLTASPVLVVDAQCLCAHLKIVRQLLKSEKFIVIIPLHVIDALDALKKGKENHSAREAIKFLEQQMKVENKWLRAQKKEESADLKSDPSRYKQKDMAAWRFNRVVDCARYFDSQLGSGLVTLLYSKTHAATVVAKGDKEEQQQHQPDTGTRPTNTGLAIANKHGLTAEEITNFYSKWKQ